MRENKCYCFKCVYKRIKLKRSLQKINEVCKDCNHLDVNNEIDGICPTCSFCWCLGHWQDAKRWPYIKSDVCQFKGLTQYEAEMLYFNRKGENESEK
jgi:hypothetical protein